MPFALFLARRPVTGPGTRRPFLSNYSTPVWSTL
jgi:hypothetical protein